MTPLPVPELDARIAALRAAVANEAPSPDTDRAIAAAIARRQRTKRADPTASQRLHAWFVWPIALVATLVVLSFIVRGLPLSSSPADDPHVTTVAPAATFMPVVPLAELARSDDALVVPARISRMSLAQFGLPVDPARAADAIDAELLVRLDGAVLAVRFVN